MNPAKLEKWTWLLIYAGLLSAGLGLSVQRSESLLGWGLVAVGGTAAVIGFALIFVRSRIKGPQ